MKSEWVMTEIRRARKVFCDDDGIDAKSMIPDHGIFGTGETDVIDEFHSLGDVAIFNVTASFDLCTGAGVIASIYAGY